MARGWRKHWAAGLVFATLLCPLGAVADELPPQYRGDWAPSGNCKSAVRLRVEKTDLVLINAADVARFGDVAIPASFFGPDYKGISVIALPEVTKGYPFTATFNVDEKKGVTKVEIYHPMKGPQNAEVQKLQNAAKALAKRFPLDGALLAKCR